METTEPQYRPGERVPGTEYVVVRLEAEGGHGALYLVRHHFLEKKIQMLKTLRSFEPSADLIERLKREAQMLAAMDHPHIVSVTSGGLTDEKAPRPYFVMERLKGRSLAQILPEAPEGVGVDAALKVTIELCDALEYVHVRHGVVHRDIKPDNIFLHVTPRNGSVTKILDFGVAHIMDLEKRYTKNNLFLGTPRYASPEQVMGERITPQTDLYAVGLVLYELLLGHGPFDDAQTFAAVATAHVRQDAPAFPTNRRFPGGLEQLVMSLLRKDPTTRPKSAEWLATQLRQIKRIAEVAEQRQSESLSQTDLSPVQNALTGHRAHLTEAGAPPDLASEPSLSDPTMSGPLGGAPDTQRVPSLASTEASSPVRAPVDRAAPTRSLLVDLPAPRRSDTEQLPGSNAWLPAGDGQAVAGAGLHASTPPYRPQPGVRPVELEPPLPSAPTTSTHAAMEITHGTEARTLRWAAAAGITAGLGISAVALLLYTRSAPPHTDGAAAGTSPPAQPSVTVPSARTASPAPPTPSPLPEATPSPTGPSAVPPSSPDGPPSAASTPRGAPAASGPPAAHGKPPPKSPMRLPSSGL